MFAIFEYCIHGKVHIEESYSYVYKNVLALKLQIYKSR